MVLAAKPWTFFRAEAVVRLTVTTLAATLFLEAAAVVALTILAEAAGPQQVYLGVTVARVVTPEVLAHSLAVVAAVLKTAIQGQEAMVRFG